MQCILQVEIFKDYIIDVFHSQICCIVFHFHIIIASPHTLYSHPDSSILSLLICSKSIQFNFDKIEHILHVQGLVLITCCLILIL